MNAVLNWFLHLIPANPMVVRVVQGGSQRMRHLFVRMGYLGALIGLVVIGLMSGGGMGGTTSLSDLAKSGTFVFAIIAYGQVILVCLLAPLFMAGAIAQERSGETYNILLTTPLTNLQIVLGSLFGRLFFVVTLLLSGLPLFAVLLIFGGVHIRSVFVAFGTSLMVALAVGAVAVTLSVLRAGGRKAVFTFIIVIAAYLVAAYAFDAFLLRQFAPVAKGTTWLTPLHPILVLEASMSPDYRPPSREALTLLGYGRLGQFYLGQPFVAFSLLSFLVSMVLVTFSSIMVRNIGTGDSKIMWAIRKKLRMDAPEGERTRAGREVWNNPIAWREASTRGKMASAIIARYGFLVVALIIASALLIFYHTGTLPDLSGGGVGSTTQGGRLETFRILLFILLMTELAVITLVAIYMSAGSVSREREDGTLDLMLTTPITPKYYIWGKLRGLVSFLTLLIAAPVLTLALVSLYANIGHVLGWETASYSYNVSQSNYSNRTTFVSDPMMILEAPLLLAVMLVPFISLCVAIGMYMSLKSRGVLAAVVPSVAILSAPVLIAGFCGFYSAGNIPFIGAVINAFSPTTNILMIVDPWNFVSEFQSSPGVSRVGMFIAACACAAGYAAIVYGVILNMVSGFDTTVRKLSGTN